MAQVEINRAVSLYNTAAFGEERTLLQPADYSDAANDIKIQSAIALLEQALLHPRIPQNEESARSGQGL